MGVAYASNNQNYLSNYLSKHLCIPTTGEFALFLASPLLQLPFKSLASFISSGLPHLLPGKITLPRQGPISSFHRTELELFTQPQFIKALLGRISRCEAYPLNHTPAQHRQCCPRQEFCSHQFPLPPIIGSDLGIKDLEFGCEMRASSRQ